MKDHLPENFGRNVDLFRMRNLLNVFSGDFKRNLSLQKKENIVLFLLRDQRFS